MPINSTSVSDRIISKLGSIDIDSHFADGKETQTAKMIRYIVEEVLREIRTSATVEINIPVVGGAGGKAIGEAKIR